MESVKDRLKTFIKSQGLKIRPFEISIGAANGYVSGMVNTIGPKFLNAILEKYPKLNREWLLYGEGEMLKSNVGNAELIGGASAAISEDTVAVRFFEVSPSATFQEFCAGTSEDATTVNIIPAANESLDDSYCVFEISGESMAPQIQPHARVLCQEVPPTRWHSISGGVIVIAYADRFVIKRVAANRLQTEDYIELSSDNPDYPQHEIVPLSDIRAIFRARRIISSEIL